MNLYVETSAIVAWLLDEERGERARLRLAAADVTVQWDVPRSGGRSRSGLDGLAVSGRAAHERLELDQVKRFG